MVSPKSPSLNVVKMNRADKFLIKIQGKNQLRVTLKEKEAELDKLVHYPMLVDEINELREQIKYIKLELKKYDN